MPDHAPLRFYFDFISHNAYVAWVRIQQIALEHERPVEPVPVLFAGFLEAGGQLGPAEIPAKARWMVRDVARKAIELGIPLAPPASHPFNPLVSLRVASLTEEELEGGGGQRRRLTAALFRAAWAESRDISDAAVVAAVADGIGLDGAGLVERATRPEVKNRLRQATDDAIALGVFGVPSVVVEDPDCPEPWQGHQLFWGFDDLPWLERWLAGDDPLRSHDFAAWARVRPSVQRKR